MKVMRTVTVPTKEEQQLDYMKCEICENKSSDPDWSPGQYEVTEPIVSLREGTSYPEGDYTTTVILDICPECFRKKLIPWFEAQGGSVREEDCE
jgi:hypothetical protein